MTRGVRIENNLEGTPLFIKTDSELGSYDEVVVDFNSFEGDKAGGVRLDFSSKTVKYWIETCSSSWTDLPTAPLSSRENIWRITLRRWPSVNLVIHCNEVVVLDVVLSDEVCTNSYYKWRDYWNKPVAKIQFLSLDSASDYYKPGNCS